MKVLEQNKRYVTKYQLATLYDLMIEHNDGNNANKIIDLFEKLTNNHFHVSFTGHFSAGKSSIINYLLDKELLPKSPIPTSANIVKITSGAGVARVFFNEENPIEYEEPYDIDLIKEFCMTKDTIKQIEIQTSEEIIPKGTFIVDTPGIDAADDSDRYMTESSLHLVDALYYVMDYNHVQSEINFTFLKQIQKRNIPIYLIINQIDKHNDHELSFATFKQIVETSFNQWEIYPEKIYYSSIFAVDSPHNELSKIKSDLFLLLKNNHTINERVSNATKQVIESHRELLEKEYDSLMTENIDAEAFNEMKWIEVNNNIKALEGKVNDLEDEFLNELEQTLKNAYLMPAKLRDIAEQYLESQQDSFKVGFFQAKRKTALERENRLQLFFTELKQTIQSTIIWKLREKFAYFLQQYHLTNEQLRQTAQSFSINFTEELLTSSLKEGATVNGQYVLNYTNEISNKIKQQSKREANLILENMKAQLKKRVSKEIETLNKQKKHMAKLRTSAMKNSTLQKSLEEKIQQVETIVDQDVENKASVERMIKKINERYHFVKEDAPIINEVDNQPTIEMESVQYEKNHHTTNHLTSELISKNIEQTITFIKDLPNFHSLIEELRSKQSRIENRSLTIALFGAFSAGKSSFSNALLGKRILPVSPNPTTAVINRIRPVTEKYKNGTVVITYKTEEVITDDLKVITNDFSPNITNFASFIQWIKENKLYENEQLSSVYQSYLVAILDGYKERQHLLGKSEMISLEQFASYVTDESIAAYIEAVDLYDDNELTRKGITLVDTPGANSVNARHTNVAFDYIKDADAILYVTYYNHAVTSADRDFLIQLGRVKESFELDKMFFIVNAADLAKDDDELTLVVDYVEEQLLQYGIRHPQIYPLSSKLSLIEKENHERLNEQMIQFEHNFEHFIEHDLHALTYEAAIWDIKRVQSRLETIIHSAKLDEREKENYINELKEKERKSIELLEEKVIDNMIERIKERIERQLHFVKERMFIRFHDMFSEHFNPTTITENGRQATAQLEKNRNQLIDYVGYELLQEVRAVSIRLEAFINTVLKEYYDQISNELLSIEETITLPNYDEKRFTTPNYVQAFSSINKHLFENTLKIFKNLRSFFEQNDREKMKDSFYTVLEPEIKLYLNHQQEIMEQAYIDQLNVFFNTMLQNINEEIKMIISQQINVLNDQIDYSIYNKKLDQITLLVDNLNKNNE